MQIEEKRFEHFVSSRFFECESSTNVDHHQSVCRLISFRRSIFDVFSSLRFRSIISMRYAAAFVLATLAGNNQPDASTISKILGSVGIECDQGKAQKVVQACQGKSIEQIIDEGMKKLSSLPAAGPAAPAAGGAAQAATTDAKKGGAKEEPKKEEKKPAKESDDEGDDMVKASLHFDLDAFRRPSRLGIWFIRLNLLLIFGREHLIRIRIRVKIVFCTSMFSLILSSNDNRNTRRSFHCH